MTEQTSETGFGNRVTYEGMDTLDGRARKAVEQRPGRAHRLEPVYSGYTEAAKQTALCIRQ